MLIVLLAAVLAILVAAVGLRPVLALSPLVWTHMVVAVAIMTLITAAMQHFVPVLTRSRGAGRWAGRLPLVMTVAGALAVGMFAGLLPYALLSVAAGIGLAGAVAMLAWMLVKGRIALGRPHSGLGWYVAAMACLVLGLVAAALIPWLPQWHAPLRAFHFTINLYGFIGLTAVGTLQVLMPTAASVPNPEVGLRLRLDLKWAVAGTVLLALGKAEWPLLAWVGAAGWGWVLLRMATAWWRLYRPRLISLHGAEPVLSAALLGFALAIMGSVSGLAQPLVVFLPGFLFPLVSGAAGYLAPVWARPGTATPWHADSRRFLNRYGGLRGLLFLIAALLPVMGYQCSGMPGLLALVWFLTLFALWLMRD